MTILGLRSGSRLSLGFGSEIISETYNEFEAEQPKIKLTSPLISIYVEVKQSQI